MSDPSTPDASGFPSLGDQPTPPTRPTLPAPVQPPPPTGQPAPPSQPFPGAPPQIAPPVVTGVGRQVQRPKSPVGAGLMILGGLIAIVGSFLPWATRGGDSINGFDDWVWVDGFELYSIESPANLALVGALLMIGLGIALLIAGRVLAVAIVGVVAGVLGIGGGLLLFAIPAAIVDLDDGSVAIGAMLQPLAPLISLVGATVVLATRARTA